MQTTVVCGYFRRCAVKLLKKIRNQIKRAETLATLVTIPTMTHYFTSLVLIVFVPI